MMVIKLTTDEYNALNKISHTTKMDCWFVIKTSGGLDFVHDLENGEAMPFDTALAQLCEGLVDPIEDPFYGLTETEQRAFSELVGRILPGD